MPTFATAFLLAVVGLFSTAYTSKDPAKLSYIGSWFDEITKPANSVIYSAVWRSTELYNRYVNLFSLQAEYQKVKERALALEGENVRLLELVNENNQLRDLLEMSKALSLQGGVGAAVVGQLATDRFHSVVIDRGEQSGVKAGMAVVDSSGVVGQIVSTSPRTARVLLLTARTSGVDVVIQSTRVRGVVEGLGKGICKLSYVGRDEKVEVGDRVVTSGADGIFPKGLPVGLVLNVEKNTSRLFHDVTLQPYLKLSKLEYVYVITNYAAGESLGDQLR